MEDYLVYIILHQHWDPAWISQRKHTEPQLISLFEDIFKKMEKYPSYKFVLDGQTHIIEDYLKQLSKKDRILKKQVLSKYVREGRLITGPFYSQVDWNLSSEELLVRNLLIGHSDAEKFGKVNKSGWAIDVFGFPAAAVRILKGFDIEAIYLSRGIGIEKKYVKEAYWWRENKGKILCIHLIESYRNLMELSKTKEFFKERIKNKAEILLPYSATKKAVLLFDGYENLPYADDIVPLISKMENVLITTPEEYQKFILNSKVKLPYISGYLNSGKYIASLSGVLSNRIYLKKRQYLCENLLEKYLEPLEVISYLFYGSYSKKFLKKLWKNLLKISSHDEICGCSVDEVHRDTLTVYEMVEREERLKINRIFRKIVSNINTGFSDDKISFVVYNPSPFENTGIISLKTELPQKLSDGFSLIDENKNISPVEVGKKEGEKFEIHFEAKNVPAFGYKTYGIVKKVKKIISDLNVSEENKMLENKYLKININSNGTIDVFDKINKRTFKNMFYFKSEGDRGDLYTASIIKDKVVKSSEFEAKITLVENNKLFATFRIEQILKLPECLTEDRRFRSEKLVDCPIVNYLTLNYNTARIDFITKFYNFASDHRLRVCFPTGIKSSFHYISHKFDVSKFPNKVKENIYSSKTNPLKGILSPAYDIFPPDGFSHKDFVYLYDKKSGIGLISSALPEYWIDENNTIELTLLRCVGWLGLDDLEVRYGRAGWKIFTPDAQCIGKHIFSYSLIFSEGDFFKAKLHIEAIKKNTEFLVAKTDLHNGHLPGFFQTLQINSNPENSLIISAIKLAEENQDLIIRFYNVLNRKVKYNIRFPFKIKSVYLTNLNEEKEREVSIRKNCIEGEAKEKEIITLRLEPEIKKLNPLNFSPSTKIIEISSYKNKKEIFDRIKFPDLVNEEVLEKEKNRFKESTKLIEREKEKLKRLQEKYSKTKSPFYRLLVEKQKMKLFETKELQQDAKYSLLLTYKRFLEIKKDYKKLKSLQKKIDKMATTLIQPRAKRQLQQFVIDYLEKSVYNSKK